MEGLDMSLMKVTFISLIVLSVLCFLIFAVIILLNKKSDLKIITPVLQLTGSLWLVYFILAQYY